ncbi:hypothetical protein [Streptomyces sp. NPDC096105]|uniref:hypothetical protein n=1 Tax=Streptomyces sp. NPDC096105 TaxID=3366074 RepID=UPI00382E6818
MESTRNWLLPAILAVPNAGILAIALLSDEVSGVLLPAGMLAGIVPQLVALGRRRSEPLLALAGTVAGMLTGALAAPEYFANPAVLVALHSVAVRCGGRITALCTAVVGCVWLPDVLYASSVVASLTQLGITASLYVPCAGLGEARRQWLSGRWAAAGPVAERLRVQAESASGRMSVDRTGTLRVSVPPGTVPVPVEEVLTSPYAYWSSTTRRWCAPGSWPSSTPNRT